LANLNSSDALFEAALLTEFLQQEQAERAWMFFVPKGKQTKDGSVLLLRKHTLAAEVDMSSVNEDAMEQTLANAEEKKLEFLWDECRVPGWSCAHYGSKDNRRAASTSGWRST
jgi:hypothetical protein